MGNLFGKDCPEQKKNKKHGAGVGWNPAAAGGGNVTRGTVDKGNLNPSDFIFSRKQKEVIVREPGSIGGQQFIVEECSECEVYLLDHTAALTIDLCTDCRIIVGPCESSVFIRDCKDCTMVVACQQFRARDCTDCTFFLFSATQPVIESSVGLRFACYTLDYFSLAGQFAAAKLSVWNNKWSQIYNFTGGGEGDWSCLPEGSHHRDFTTRSLPKASRQRVGYTENTNGAVVPITAGMRGLTEAEETCFIVVMPGHIDAVLGKLLAVGGGGDSPISATTSRLLRTKLFRPQMAQSKTFFSGAPSSMAELASSFPVLGMQWAGPGSVEAAVSLLAAAGVSIPPSPATPPPPPPNESSAKKGKKPKEINNNFADVGAGNGTSEYYMVAGRGDGGGDDDGRGGSESSAAKARVFFEQWDEDKGTPLGS
ncbi:unnamed protein product [Ectocarpus sp. 12 AP-2014]